MKLTKLFLWICGLFACLVAGEAVLRLSKRFPPPIYPPKSRHPELEAYEPIGYRLHPSHRTTIPYPPDHPRMILVVSNRDGFRASRELDEPDPRPRVVFLGDGFVSGDGNQESERFTNRLEARMPSLRMDNLAMTGFSPDLALRTLETFGLKLKPKLVVFCMYTDAYRRVRPEYDGSGFAIPRYELDSGHLVSVPYPRLHFWDLLSLSAATKKILWTYTNWQWDLNQAILDRYEQLGDEQPFQKAILFLPGTDDNSSDRKRRGWLKQYADRHGTPFLDLSDPMHKIGERAFIPGNPHYSPAGHQVIAEELERFFRDRHLPSL